MIYIKEEKSSTKWYLERKNFDLEIKTRKEMVDILGEDKVKKSEELAEKNPGMKVNHYVGKGMTQRTYFVQKKA